eukprot:COSAG04_NODE_91_length_26852_cov_8.609315_35_plen_89_part_00
MPRGQGIPSPPPSPPPVPLDSALAAQEGARRSLQAEHGVSGPDPLWGLHGTLGGTGQARPPAPRHLLTPPHPTRAWLLQKRLRKPSLR